MASRYLWAGGILLLVGLISLGSAIQDGRTPWIALACFANGLIFSLQGLLTVREIDWREADRVVLKRFIGAASIRPDSIESLRRRGGSLLLRAAGSNYILARKYSGFERFVEALRLTQPTIHLKGI